MATFPGAMPSKITHMLTHWEFQCVEGMHVLPHQSALVGGAHGGVDVVCAMNCGMRDCQ